MRLTLRTLLAYLDDILDPPEAKELGKKIEDSEFASGLVHRIRSSMRRLRLGAPKLTGKGMGLDPNTVAEYLDNTLPQDRVPDFEKVCLESDVHLAEVASCHQILTLVLGEPADVDPELRHRIYRIGSTSPEKKTPASSNGQSEESSAATPPPPPPPKAAPQIRPEVPDYLYMRGSQGVRLKPLLATMILAFLAATVALVAIGPLDHEHPVIGFLFSDPEVADADNGGPPADDANPVGDADAQKKAATDPSNGSDTQPPSDPNQADRDTSDTAPQAVDPNGQPVRPPVQPADVAPAGTDAANNTPPPAVATEGNDAVTTPPPGTAEPPPVDRAPTDTDPMPTVDAEPPVSPEPLTDAEAVQRVGVDVGRFTSATEVIGRWDEATGVYLRLPPLTQLNSGDQLFVLPTYRPQMLLAPGMQCILVGPVEVQLQAPDTQEIPGIVVRHGRALLFTDAQPQDLQVRLQLGPRLGTLRFLNPDATVAIEVERFLKPGSDPEQDEAVWFIQIHVSGGNVSWTEILDSETKTSEVGDRQTCQLLGQAPAEVVDTTRQADWISDNELVSLERRANKELEQLLPTERSLALSLTEQQSHRQIEVRTLVLRCLAALNQFDGFTDALNDQYLRAYWRWHWASLRSALARSPQSAAAIRGEFEKSRGPVAADLYRLLWSYDNEQLQAGAAQQLVEYLRHPEMDIRVLTYFNLVEITEKTHAYQPEKEPDRQRAAILDWQESQQQGSIVLRRSPLPSEVQKYWDGQAE